MRSLGVLLFNIGLCLCFVLAGMHAASAVMSEPPAQRKLDMTAQTVWTLTPVRVDPSKQTYERLPTPPDPYPVKFRADRSVRVLDNVTFERKGKRYRVSDAPVVARNQVCVEGGKRYACGLRAFKALDNAIRGKYLECRIGTEIDAVATAECRVNGRDLATIL